MRSARNGGHRANAGAPAPPIPNPGAAERARQGGRSDNQSTKPVTPEGPMPVPHQCTSVAIICGNAQQQLVALSQAYSRNDLQDEIPRLTTTARNAVKLARDMLDGLLERLEAKPRRAGR